MNATAVIEKKELNGNERGQASCDDCALSGTKLWTDESVARPKSSQCDGAGVTYANAGNCYNCPLHQKVCAS